MSAPVPPEDFTGADGFELLPELEGGAYAEGVALWHTPFTLVLDFLVPTFPPRDGQSGPEPVQPARVVARVRLPIGMAFELIRGVSAIMGDYEAEWGEIRRPEPRPRGEP